MDKDYSKIFIERGYLPLETPTKTKQKIKCMDKEGYLYYASYEELRDRRDYSLDKWKKCNPYKHHNIRLYASVLEPECEIVSSDEELQDADNIKTKFRCPSCGEIYEKRWYHWIAQPRGKHLCQKCNIRSRTNSKIYSYAELQSLYSKKGFKLISDYQYYLKNELGKTRMHCQDVEGYKYAINLDSLRVWRSGGDVKYSITNPFAKENLQLWCDKNRPELEIVDISFDEKMKKAKFTIRCECGNLFEAFAYKVPSEEKIRCAECIRHESGLERKTREWFEENNIHYVSQYRFDDCRYKRTLPFDFKVDWNGQTILIEVDGQQHYYISEWNNEDRYNAQVTRDKIKTDYCKKHGYILLRLPCWNFTNDTYKTKLNKTFFG